MSLLPQIQFGSFNHAFLTICATLMLLHAKDANSVEISYGMGEATTNTRLQSCAVAENLAIKNALINFNEQQYTSTEQLVCVDDYCDFIKEIDSSTSGTIRSIVDRHRKVKEKTCFIEVTVEIEPAVQLPVSVDSKRFYHEGDNIEIDVNTGKPLYLHIFNLYNNTVDILFPNRYNDESLIDDRFVFPSDGVEVTATTGGKKESKETLLFLFTKQRQLIDPEITMDDLETLLRSIPVTEKRLIRHTIVIRSI